MTAFKALRDWHNFRWAECGARKSLNLFLVVWLVFLGSPHLVQAQAEGIMVAPTRVVLEPGQHTAQVFVMNKGAEPITARISLVNRHMLEDGSFAIADNPRPGEYFADGFVRYAPRRVHLAPGQGQTVRILAQPIDERGPAEYRSHLLFSVEPSTTGESSAGENRGLAIRLIPVYGVSIPVIVRTGALTASATIDDLTVQRDPSGVPHATFRLHRSGDRSIYGDVQVFYQPHNGDERLIGKSRGLAVYPPLSTRRVSIPLNLLDGVSLQPPGRLRVQFVKHKNHARVLAEANSSVR